MTAQTIKFDVFGRGVLVSRSGKHWKAYYLGDDGKRRSAPDIVIPSDLGESQIEQYLDDLCHEWASEKHTGVKRLD